MKSEKRLAYVTRDDILKLLSDAEIACVSTAETVAQLSDGDEYLDLQRLDQGVRKALGSTAYTSSVLARKSVHEDTWTKIVSQLRIAAVAGLHSRR
jgi:hypothetical protein